MTACDGDGHDASGSDDAGDGVEDEYEDEDGDGGGGGVEVDKDRRTWRRASRDVLLAFCTAQRHNRFCRTRFTAHH